VPAASNHSWLTARWRTPLTATLEATVTARTFEETRRNGTPYQRNGSRSNFASVVLAGTPAKTFSWSGTAYAQTGSFASTFSAVNATRTAETPASDQIHRSLHRDRRRLVRRVDARRRRPHDFGLDARAVRARPAKISPTPPAPTPASASPAAAEPSPASTPSTNNRSAAP